MTPVSFSIGSQNTLLIHAYAIVLQGGRNVTISDMLMEPDQGSRSLDSWVSAPLSTWLLRLQIYHCMGLVSLAVLRKFFTDPKNKTG
jgi:hypothetical protein